MFFEISTYEDATGGWVEWRYRQGSLENPGAGICKSMDVFPDEPACRRDIAAARKAFSGAKFAKVVTK